MSKFTVWKTRALEVDVDTKTAVGAIGTMLSMYDVVVTVDDSERGVVDGEHIDSDDIRLRASKPCVGRTRPGQRWSKSSA